MDTSTLWKLPVFSTFLTLPDCATGSNWRGMLYDPWVTEPLDSNTGHMASLIDKELLAEV